MIDTTHLHPMIVHFPIALIIVGFLAELLSFFIKKEFFSTAAFYLLILGTLGVVAAYFTGQYAGDGITEVGALKQALETHEEAAELTLWVMVVAAVSRISIVLLKKYHGAFKSLAFILFLLGVVAIARTGFYGGELVYKHAAGVKINLGLDLPADNTNSTETQDSNKSPKDDDD
ncbi:MAG: hypothetical protein M1495_17415 [Bacteroidetes bacterium]|nr:hypothetical protein [Bacteroidota bacterium]